MIRATLAAVAVFSAGCSAKTACRDDADDALYVTSATKTDVASASLEGSATLTSQGEVATHSFIATLGGLPELWQGPSAILSGNVSVALGLSYANGAGISDGQTEMPRVGVSFRPRRPSSSGGFPVETTSFPLETSTFSDHMFDECHNDDDTLCCPYGVRECKVPFTLQLERLDGGPFPDVVVDSSVSTYAAVSTCPLKEGNPMLSLERVEP